MATDQPLSSFGRRSLLIRSGCMLGLVEMMVRRKGFIHSRETLERWARQLPGKRKAETDQSIAQGIAKIIDQSITRTSLFPARCLTRSLTLHFFLLRYGQNSEIRLGVRNVTGVFEAHAWVESEGVPLNEAEAVNQLYSLMDWTQGQPPEKTA